MAGYVREEFADEVADGGGGEVDGVAVGAGAEVGLAAGDVEVGHDVVKGEADEVRVVGHPLSVVAPSPEDLHNCVADAAVDGGMLHTVVVRVLMGKGGDEEDAEELAGHVSGDAHADGAAEAWHAWAVGGVAVGGDRNASFTGDSDEAERVEEVARG